MDSSAMNATEFVCSRRPFVVRRTVRWQECDPAGVVYAGRFPEYLLSAVDLLRQDLLAEERAKAGDRFAYRTPGKALGLVFKSPLWPGDVFDIAMYVGSLGRTTTTFAAHAYRADNRADVFVGRVTSIYVSSEDRLKTIEIPAGVRNALEAYQAAAPMPADLTKDLGP
ncbi:MAG: acyl-CoA thioesterase [Rhodospirillaceae bacterium]|nr:acyl-CoA thioesterase [Rhodospirillaceae bacterium]